MRGKATSGKATSRKATSGKAPRCASVDPAEAAAARQRARDRAAEESLPRKSGRTTSGTGST